MYKILSINPGSTSTKIAVYHDDKQVFQKSIQHPAEQVAKFEHVFDQYDMRKQLILDALAEAGIPLDFDATSGRGGLSKPLEGGCYEVTQQMIDDIWACEHQHACDLGSILAADIAKMCPNCKAFMADPGVTDELCDYARISGSPLMPRICIWHALNQRAVARHHAKVMGTKYEDMNLIICHLGGGISVAAHQHGRAIDANNALDGEGPFSPERAGSLPANDLIRLCYSGKFTMEQLLKRIAGHAGLTAHLGTNDMREVERRIDNGDTNAKLLVDAMIYHVSKNIAAEAAVLCGKIDAIILTGGLAYWKYVPAEIAKRVGFLAPIYTYPGEGELDALADNALLVLRGEMQPKNYADFPMPAPVELF